MRAATAGVWACSAVNDRKPQNIASRIVFDEFIQVPFVINVTLNSFLILEARQMVVHIRAGHAVIGTRNTVPGKADIGMIARRDRR